MIDGMKIMTHWHTDSFNSFPIGDGYEVEDTKDGASAHRLDWNGLSFVWTGDGKPDALTAMLAKGVDVFVTETRLTTLKYGMPPIMTNMTIDSAHTPHYATGYLFKQVNPRAATATHVAFDEGEVSEIVAGFRVHWPGLFQFGAPDDVVVNVTMDAIWTRKAALPDSASPVRPSPSEAIALFDLSLRNTEVKFPSPRHSVEAVQEQFVRDQEFDLHLYYPKDV